MDFSEIASVSGKGGLFKVLKPTRTGAVLESLDDEKKRLVVGMNAKVSVLSDISVYTIDGDGAVPLSELMTKIHAEFNGDTGLTKNSDNDELKSFLKFILPSYDEERVYVSDIKKIVHWYNQLHKIDPSIFEQKEGDKESEIEENEHKKETKKKPSQDAKKDQDSD